MRTKYRGIALVSIALLVTYNVGECRLGIPLIHDAIRPRSNSPMSVNDSVRITKEQFHYID